MKIHTPPMTFKDDKAAKSWEEGLLCNQDFYGNGIYRYASEWATRMEAELAKGKALQDVAKKCSHGSDDEGVSGFMYGAAAAMLAIWWKHGEEFRRWYNLDTQIGNEGEKANEKEGATLNPALVTIDTGEGE